MALNIPNQPTAIEALMNGIKTGSNFYSNLMQPILNREGQTLQRDIHKEQNALNREHYAQLEKHFEREMALKQQQESRMASEMGLKRALLQARIEALNKKSAPLSPLEKSQIAINQATAIDAAKANRKKIEEIEKTATELMPFAGNVQTIEDILNREPQLTGRLTQLSDTLGINKNEDVGKFISAAQNLQAHMAKAMSSRGGYGVSKLVEQGKPNIGKSSAFNKGVVSELKETMKNAFEQMNQDYMKLTGKKLPHDFEKFYKKQLSQANSQNEMVAMISPSGKRVMIPYDKVEAALASGGKYA